MHWDWLHSWKKVVGNGGRTFGGGLSVQLRAAISVINFTDTMVLIADKRRDRRRGWRFIGILKRICMCHSHIFHIFSGNFNKSETEWAWNRETLDEISSTYECWLGFSFQEDVNHGHQTSSSSLMQREVTRDEPEYVYVIRESFNHADGTMKVASRSFLSQVADCKRISLSSASHNGRNEIFSLFERHQKLVFNRSSDGWQRKEFIVGGRLGTVTWWRSAARPPLEESLTNEFCTDIHAKRTEEEEHNDDVAQRTTRTANDGNDYRHLMLNENYVIESSRSNWSPVVLSSFMHEIHVASGNGRGMVMAIKEL